MELLSQSIAAHEAEPDYKKFLIDVRKEKISFLVFGVPIPNADLERVITYCRKAATGVGVVAWVSMVHEKEVIALVCVSLISVVFTTWINQGLFTAARLAKLEKKSGN